jgi:hypothetical protein
MPTSDTRIRRVTSFHELATTPFADGINALCWERSLPGDFAEVVRLLSVVGPGADRAPEASEESPGLTTIVPATLESLLSRRVPDLSVPDPEPVEGLTPRLESIVLSSHVTPHSSPSDHPSLSASGRKAVELLLEDLRLLRSIDRDPILNLIHGYPRDADGGPVPTDVFSFHADSAPVPADTWLCTYHGPPSEGLRNEDAVRKIDVPAIRAELLKLHGGPDDASFAEFLHENHFDLHYAAKLQCRASDVPVPGPEAAEGLTPLRTSAISDQASASAPPDLSTFNIQPSTPTPLVSRHSSLPTPTPSASYSFGVGHLWRICCEYPNAPVPPCIHRAPAHSPNDPPRLLLIS